MAESPSQGQRLALALRKLREDAGLTTRALADKLGVSQSIVTKVENLKVRAKPELVERWAHQTGAPAETAEGLVELARFARVESTPWQSDQPGGFAAQQRRVARREETATVVRAFSPTAIPGLLQVHDYARHAIATIKPASPDAQAANLAARMQRQAVLSESSKRFEFLLGEPAFRWLFGPPATMIAQIRHVQSAMTLPNVTVGVVPLMTDAVDVYLHSFILYENPDEEFAEAVVETWVGEQAANDPEDVTIFQRGYEQIRSVTVFDDEARALLDRIAADLRRAPE